MSKSLEEKTKVIPVKAEKDSDDKKFIPICSYGMHIGIVKNYWVCEKRQCSHYIKLFL